MSPQAADPQNFKLKASERLAQELRALGEFEMEKRAREGYYGDFTSPLATPIMQLVADLSAKGHHKCRSARHSYVGRAETEYP